MTTAMLLRLLADHLLTLDPVDGGFLVNAARRRAEELDKKTVYLDPSKMIEAKMLRTFIGDREIVAPSGPAPQAGPPLGILNSPVVTHASDAKPFTARAAAEMIAKIEEVNEKQCCFVDAVDSSFCAAPAAHWCGTNEHDGVKLCSRHVEHFRGGEYTIRELDPPPADEPKTIAWREWL